MRLDQALNKIGVEVIKVDQEESSLTLYLRVNQKDPQATRRWQSTARKVVLASEKASRGGTWSADVSKWLYPSGNSVKFVWRVMIQGHLNTAQRIFGEAALESLREGVEVTSMPVVGRQSQSHNYQEGKTKGGHPLGVAERVVASHFSHGGGS